MQTTVAADWVAQQCYDKALAAAKDLAKKADRKMLQITALTEGMPAFYTGYFLARGREDFRQACRSQGRAAGQRRGDETPRSGHARCAQSRRHRRYSLARMVIVAQLDGTRLAFPPGELWRHRLADAAQFNQTVAEGLAQEYFTYDAVAKRLDYKPAQEKS